MRKAVNRLLVATTLVFCSFALGTVASADTVTINNNDSGWYSNLGNRQVGNTNYAAGNFTNSYGSHLRNYFVFNLAPLSGTVTGARLELWTYTITGSGVYTLYDVAANPATLQSTGSSLPTYVDLGTGSSFGSISLSSIDSNTLITINLNAAAVAAIQASSGGMFVVGGDFISSGVVGLNSGFDLRNRLVIDSSASVPEPAAILLLGSGLTALAGALRRRKFKSTQI